MAVWQQMREQLGFGVGSQFSNFFGEFIGYLGKTGPHAGRHGHHGQSLGFDADLFEQLLNEGDPLGRLGISVFKVAVAVQAAGDQNTVGSLLQRFHHVNGIHLAAAWHPHDFHVGRVIQTHRTGHIGGGVCAVVAAEGHNDRFKCFHQAILSSNPSSLAIIGSSSKHAS